MTRDRLPAFEILQGDCLDRLRDLAKEGRKFDALVADPPYCSGAMSPADISRGTGIAKYCERTDLGSFSDAMSQRAFLLFTREWLHAARAVMKSPGYCFVFIDWRQLPTVSDAIQTAGWIWRGIAVWDKGNARPNFGHVSQTTEFIVWGTVDAEKSKKIVPQSVFRKNSPKMADRIHPTQKEPEVIRGFLEVLPDDATAVLDPFSGSASTGIAALSLGLDYVGIEEQPGFCEVSRGRLAESLRALEATGTFVDKKRAESAPRLF